MENAKYANNGRYKIVPSSYLLLIKDKKVLLAKRCNTGFEDGNYGLVAGHGEENESATDTFLRETNEEAGIIVKKEDAEIVHVMHRKSIGDERVDFFFGADSYEGEPKIMEPDRCDDMGWFPVDNLPENTIDYIKQAIDCYNKGIFYSEYGWDK